MLSAKSLLYYLPEYRVLVCQSPCCQHAIRPSGVDEHLKRLHKICAKDQKVYIEQAATLDLIHLEELQYSSRGQPAIRELKIHKGWSCCRYDYVITNEKVINNHAYEKHGWSKKQEPQ